jgi:hypothetical protein
METICHAELISASEIPLISPSSKGEVLGKIPAGSRCNLNPLEFLYLDGFQEFVPKN